MADLSAYNPWAAPVFPNRDDNAMQPETYSNPLAQALLSQLAGAIGRGFMAPGQALASTTPITSGQMVAPAMDMAGMTMGTGAIAGVPVRGAEAVLGAGPIRARVYKGMNPYRPETLPDRNWKGEVINGTEGRVPQEITSFVRPDAPHAGFFSDDPAVASRFADSLTKQGAVFPADLTMRNPLVIDAQGKPAAAFQFDAIAREHGTTDQLKQFRDALQNANHDGIVLQNTADEGTVYVPKSGEQVRSQFAPSIGEQGSPLAIKDAVEAPAVADDMIRLYRGGGNNQGGPKWVTTNRKYAEGYTTPGLAHSPGGGSYLQYADIPATDARVQMPAGQSTHSFEAPADIADQLKPFYRPKQ